MLGSGVHDSSALFNFGLTARLATQVTARTGVFVVAVLKLLPRFGSAVVLETNAIFDRSVPLATVESTVATKVTTAEAPDGNDAKVIVRVLPDPPHVPPPVEEQETNMTSAGRGSCSVTAAAGL